MTRFAVTAAEPNAARTSPSAVSTTTASEQIAITIAFRGPTFAKVCAPPLGLHSHGGHELVGRERRPLDAEQEVLERQRPHAPHVRELDLGPLGEERRQCVARGRPGAEIAADRPAVTDLR